MSAPLRARAAGLTATSLVRRRAWLGLAVLVAFGAGCRRGDGAPTMAPPASPATSAAVRAHGPSDAEAGSTAASSAAFAAAASAERAPQAVVRDPRWATPLSRPGLPNLHRVAEGLYRGAQPTVRGFAELGALGVRTIVNLRSMHSDTDLISASGVPPGSFQYIELPMNAWRVDEAELVSFLRVATDPARRPLFVHCQHGADRTGVALAAYRVVVERWSPEDAAREMTDGGYGFHLLWSNLVHTVERLDAERLRRKLASGAGDRHR